MTAEQFAYWLQGYAELTNEAPTAEQWQSIREHLALVFNKVTPPMQPPPNWHTQPVFAVPQTSATPLRIDTRVTC